MACSCYYSIQRVNDLLLKKREAINKIEQDSIKTTFHQGHKALTSVVLNKELAGHRLDKSLDEAGYLNTVSQQ